MKPPMADVEHRVGQLKALLELYRPLSDGHSALPSMRAALPLSLPPSVPPSLGP